MLYLMNSRTYNWRFFTEPSRNCGERPFFWPRGKCLGGSSSINAMIYTRGHPWDYDNWEAMGNAGWGYKDALPMFKKSERFSKGDSEFHSSTGEMDVVDTNFRFKPSQSFLDACHQAGFEQNSDMNGAVQEGCGFFQVTQTPDGQRCNASLAFLDSIRNRTNLTIITGGHVRRILFNGNTATGIEYSDAKTTAIKRTISASKEVILSAGVIGSPQLLKISGVGPAKELNDHGIPVVRDLPGVGENLQDHPDIMLRYRDRSKSSFVTRPNRTMLTFAKAMLLDKKNFNFTPTDCGGFIKSSEEEAIPDLQLQFAPIRMNPHGKGLFSPSKAGFVLHICHLRPASRGKVLLRSSSPFDPPIIQPNYFDQQKELKALVNGIKIGREILSQPAMALMLGEEEAPGRGVIQDEQIEKYVRDHVETVYHTAGTCKMGNDSMSVVNSQLKVHGLQNLRVIDSSIMPEITGSNIHAPTVMIAEKGSEFLLGE